MGFDEGYFVAFVVLEEAVRGAKDGEGYGGGCAESFEAGVTGAGTGGWEEVFSRDGAFGGDFLRGVFGFGFGFICGI